MTLADAFLTVIIVANRGNNSTNPDLQLRKAEKESAFRCQNARLGKKLN
jgi:hypothetical protein